MDDERCYYADSWSTISGCPPCSGGVTHVVSFSREREDVREARLAYGNRFSVCPAHAQWLERQPGVTVQAMGP